MNHNSSDIIRMRFEAGDLLIRVVVVHAKLTIVNTRKLM